MMKRMGLLAVVCLMASLMAVWPQAQGGGNAAVPPTGAQLVTGPGGSFGTFAPWVPDAARPIGFMVRNYLNHPSVPLTNKAKQKMLDGKQIYGWTESRPDSAEYCAMAPHFDFIWIEMQHSRMTFYDVERMIAACPGVGVPIIRVPDPTEGNIQKATDLGAAGVIVPEVSDAIKSLEAGRFSHVPPLGWRSGGGTTAAREAYNDNMLTIVMIETPVGAFNIGEIASQLGVDVVITGNGDLAGSSGYAPTDPRYQDLVIKVHDGALRAGKFFGTASGNYRTGTPISKDARFFQSGPSIDGFQPPARGAAPAGGRQAAPPAATGR